MNSFLNEIKIGFSESPRLFFAPIIGALSAIKKIDRDGDRHRNATENINQNFDDLDENIVKQDKANTVQRR